MVNAWRGAGEEEHELTTFFIQQNEITIVEIFWLCCIEKQEKRLTLYQYPLIYIKIVK